MQLKPSFSTDCSLKIGHKILQEKAAIIAYKVEGQLHD